MPSRNLRSPHKPKLQVVDCNTLRRFYDIRISSNTAKADDDTEAFYQQCVRDNRANLSLKQLPDVLEFCIKSSNQDFQGFPKWLWNQETHGSSGEKFLEMMKYTLTDFHLNCLAASKAVNDERTPYIEHVVPPFKAFSKVFKILSFTW